MVPMEASYRAHTWRPRACRRPYLPGWLRRTPGPLRHRMDGPGSLCGAPLVPK